MGAHGGTGLGRGEVGAAEDNNIVKSLASN